MAKEAIAAALAHHRAGRLAQAEEIYRRVLEADAQNVDALHLLGVVAQQQGRHEASLKFIDQALGLRPGLPDAWYNRGASLHALGRYEEAIASCDRALVLKPHYVEALNNRGNALQALQRHEEALAAYDEALRLAPHYAEALSNRGRALHELRRYEDALASCDRALTLAPDLPEALHNRGNALTMFRRYEEALADYEQALEIKPDYASAHFNRAVCRLALGDYERGWQEYEWRWLCDELRNQRRRCGEPLWLGKEDLQGKTILLHAEGGFGDTIQFVRYVELVAGRGAKVVLEVQPELKSLMASTYVSHVVIGRGESPPPFDFHCPLLSLPLALGTRLETIPASVPYLRPAPGIVQKWRDRLRQTDDLRIGIAWSGQPAYQFDSHRSISLAKFLSLGQSNAEFISLQREVRDENAPVLAGHSHIRHFGAELADFSDTAALVTGLDLVISVDTAVANLAGAMGRPVWILLAYAADWRWLTDRQDSPWYPTARLFRQPKRGDWDGVLNDVGTALSAWVASRSST